VAYYSKRKRDEFKNIFNRLNISKKEGASTAPTERSEDENTFTLKNQNKQEMKRLI